MKPDEDSWFFVLPDAPDICTPLMVSQESQSRRDSLLNKPTESPYVPDLNADANSAESHK